MNQNYFYSLVVLSILFLGCNKQQEKVLEKKGAFVQKIDAQYQLLFENIQSQENTKKYLPRNSKDGKIGYISSYDWTSGFYPGALWKMYELTKHKKWKIRAIAYTERMDSVKFFTDNHDIGFMIGCSFGNAIKMLNTPKYDDVIVQSAKTLAKRFRPKAGVIQSWNKGDRWDCPVIIDNMMNLELLCHATRISGDSTYYNIAVKHANNTLKNHFREDASSYHVLDYDINTGAVVARKTHQGVADSSAWARGQAWGLYGFTVMYRETKNRSYLEQAIKIANFIKNHPNLPKDQIPYWDFDIEKTEEAPRDASAAAIIASALLELCNYMPPEMKENYRNWAISIIDHLSSGKYLAKIGENNGFILKHSVGSMPHNMEIDVALNYADYYYLEALNRANKLN